MTDMIEAEPFIADGFSWTECPRWYAGRLYFVDMFNARVMTADAAGNVWVFADLSSRTGLDDKPVVPTGIGFLPDGRLLINSMMENVTLVWDGEKADVYADLRPLGVKLANDLVVDATGRAYVSQMGHDMFAGEPPADAPLVTIDESGNPRIIEEAGLLSGANGLAITASGSTLIVAELMASRVLGFDILEDGGLAARRVFAEVESVVDGLCVDAENAVWAALPVSGVVVRVREGGEVVSRVEIPPQVGGASIACVLGDEDRQSLFVCCGFEVFDWGKSVREGRGSIWKARVSVPGGTARP